MVVIMFANIIAAYNAASHKISQPIALTQTISFARSLFVCFLFGNVSMEVCLSTELLVDVIVSEKSFGLADCRQKVIEKTVQLVQAKVPEGFCPRTPSL